MKRRTYIMAAYVWTIICLALGAGGCTTVNITGPADQNESEYKEYPRTGSGTPTTTAARRPYTPPDTTLSCPRRSDEPVCPARFRRGG